MQQASEKRLDQIFDDSNVQLAIHDLEGCRLSIVANISGQVTREVRHVKRIDVLTQARG